MYKWLWFPEEAKQTYEGCRILRQPYRVIVSVQPYLKTHQLFDLMLMHFVHF